MLDAFAIGVGVSVGLTGMESLTQLASNMTKISEMAANLTSEFKAMGVAMETAFSSSGVANFETGLTRSLMTMRSMTGEMANLRSGQARVNAAMASQNSINLAASGINPVATRMAVQRMRDRERNERDMANYDRSDAKAMDAQRNRQDREQRRRGGMIGGTIGALAGFETLSLIRDGFHAIEEMSAQIARFRMMGYSPSEQQKMVNEAININVPGVTLPQKLFGLEEAQSILGRDNASPKIMKAVAQDAQVIQKITGQGTLQSNERDLLRMPQLSGGMLGPDGKLDENATIKTINQVTRGIVAGGGNFDAATYRQVFQQASQGLRAMGGTMTDPLLAKLNVLTENLGSRAGAAFNQYYRQTERGQLTDSPKRRAFLQRFHLLDATKIQYDPDPVTGKPVARTYDMLKGFDPNHPDQFMALARENIVKQLTREEGHAPSEAEINRQFDLVNTSVRAGRASMLDSIQGIEAQDNLKKNISLTSTDEKLAEQGRDVAGGITAITASLEDLVNVLTGDTGKIEKNLYGIADAIHNLSVWSSDHPAIAQNLAAGGIALAGVQLFKFVGGFTLLGDLLGAMVPQLVVLTAVIAGMGKLYDLLGGASARSNPYNSRTQEGRNARAALRDAEAAQVTPPPVVKQLSDFGPTTGPRSGDTRKKYNDWLASVTPAPASASTPASPTAPAPTAAPSAPVYLPRQIALPPPPQWQIKTGLPAMVDPNAGIQYPQGYNPLTHTMPGVAGVGARTPTAATQHTPAPINVGDIYAKTIYVSNIEWGKVPPPGGADSGTSPSTGVPHSSIAPLISHPVPPAVPGGAGNFLANHFGGGPAAPFGDVKQSPQMKSFLNTLAIPESGGDYHKQYGGKDIADLSKHPNQAIMAGGYTSTAFGKYQFLNSTWDQEQKKLGLPDMSPASQDKAAADLATTTYRNRTGRDLNTDLLNPEMLPMVEQTLRSIWPSLPGGSQSHTSQDTFMSRYNNEMQAPGANDVSTKNAVMPQKASNEYHMQTDIHLDGEHIASYMYNNMFDFDTSASSGTTGFDKGMNPWAPGSSIPR